MTGRPVDLSAGVQPLEVSTRIELVMEVIVIGLLAFMPAALGVIAPWSEMIVLLAAGTLASLLAVRHVVLRQEGFVWTWTYIPIAAIALLAVVQLLPLPDGLLRVISPNTLETRTALLGELAGTGRATISFYPNATRQGLRLVLAIAAIFTVAMNLYRRPAQIKRLLMGITVIGGGFAVLALAQRVSDADAIYWSIPVRSGGATGGPFVNHNNFSQFMSLSIGAAVGLILMRLHEEFQGRHPSVADVASGLTQPAMRGVWFAVGAVVLGVAAVFLSMSRGGMISLLVAGGFTAVMLSLKRGLQGRGWVIVILALFSFIVVLYLGFDAVCDRLSTLQDPYRAEGGRIQIVKDIASAWTKFPAVGAGLGTHEVVYPMFDRSTIPALAAHAENEYAQMAEECGLAGLLALAALALIIWRAYAVNIRHLSIPVRSAAFGLGFGLLAVSLHSLSDFGQHLPANASLTAIFGALMINIHRMGSAGDTSSTAPSRPERKTGVLAGAIVMACLIAGLGWAVQGADAARRAQAHWTEALVMEKAMAQAGWASSNAECAALIGAAEAAAACEPDSVQYQYWLSVYRWRAISRVVDPNTGSSVLPPRGIEFTRRIVDGLSQARLLCPTFGSAYSVMGQLQWYVLADPQGKQNIQAGYRLAPCDPTSCLVAGELDVREGRADEGFLKLDRAKALDGRLFGEITQILIRQGKRPDLALKAADGRPGRLFQLEQALRQETGQEQIAAEARRQAVELLKAQAESADASANVLAQMAGVCEYEKDLASATLYYERALVKDYGQVNWRLRRARLLARQGQLEEAIHEARICLRLRPQLTEARTLIEQLSLLPKAPS